jgi:hypothetical protein
MERMVLRVTFFRKFGPGAPMGECELYLVCHCDSKGFTALEVGRRYCEKRARDTCATDIDGDIAEKLRGCCCLEICNGDRLARIDLSEKEKWPLC